MFYNGMNVILKCILFNFILGARGFGKTFFFKIYGVNQYKETRKKFVYVRRFKSETKEKKMKKFFTKVQAEGYFKEDNFDFKNSQFYMNGELIGYCVTLSQALTMKSEEFTDISFIWFEEFILEKGHYKYLPNEVEEFLGLYETLCRGVDIPVYFTANAVTQANPYFLYFDITLPKNKQEILVKNDILIQMAESKEFSEHRKQTRFGKLIENTDFGKYSINNEFRLDRTDFIEKKSGTSVFLCNIVYRENVISFWNDYRNGKVYCSLTKHEGITYASTTEDMKNNTMFHKNMNTSKVLTLIINSYKKGCLFYESDKVFAIVRNIIKIYLR